MLTNQIQTFADIGRMALKSEFVNVARSITDNKTLGKLQDLLSEEAGDIDRVYDVTLDGETFKGKAEQRFGIAKKQIYQFAISPTNIQYQIVNAVEMAEYAESDAGWADIVEFAAATKTRKAPKCKPGNVRCGGKCQKKEWKCSKIPTPDQVEQIESLAENLPPAASSDSNNFIKTPSISEEEKKPRVKMLESGNGTVFLSQILSPNGFDLSEDQIVDATAAIQQLGYALTQPIIAPDPKSFAQGDEKYSIITGSGIYEAAKRAGLQRMNVLLVNESISEDTLKIMLRNQQTSGA